MFDENKFTIMFQSINSSVTKFSNLIKHLTVEHMTLLEINM